MSRPKGKTMSNENSNRLTPKRGAFPTPKDILANSTPFRPDESTDPASIAEQPDAAPDSTAQSHEPDPGRANDVDTGKHRP
jgi:hypothetical protein